MPPFSASPDRHSAPFSSGIRKNSQRQQNADRRIGIHAAQPGRPGKFRNGHRVRQRFRQQGCKVRRRGKGQIVHKPGRNPLQPGRAALAVPRSAVQQLEVLHFQEQQPEAADRVPAEAAAGPACQPRAALCRSRRLQDPSRKDSARRAADARPKRSARDRKNSAPVSAPSAQTSRSAPRKYRFRRARPTQSAYRTAGIHALPGPRSDSA